MNKLPPLLILFFPLFLSAQTPQGLNYQAIAWDKNNLPKANLTIQVEINIRNLRIDGPVVYKENPSPTTNAQGYFILTIGSENPDEFQKINWASGSKFLQVIIDGISTTTQIMSVPYALYAENVNLKAGTGIQINNHVISNTGDGDKDDENELQNLKLTGYKLELDKGGGSVTLPKVGITEYSNSIFGFFLQDGLHDTPVTLTVPETGRYLIMLRAQMDIVGLNENVSVEWYINEVTFSNFSSGTHSYSDFLISNFTANEKLVLRYKASNVFPGGCLIIRPFFFIQKI